MVSNRITCMDFYLNLFSASIAMAGFIAVFLVFRYQTIDIYVDNRKKVLRSLLKKEIKDNPYIAVEVQDIGKKPEVDYIKLFLQFTNKTNKNAVSRFVDDILKFRSTGDCPETALESAETVASHLIVDLWRSGRERKTSLHGHRYRYLARFAGCAPVLYQC